jgi:protein-S-isoprenylcysteine O-methyltransferase Ste14
MVTRIISFMWVGLGAYWAVTAGAATSAAYRQSRGSRLSTLAMLAGGFTLLFWPPSRVGALGQRLTVDTPLTRAAALLLTAAGLAFAVWARARLGRNWSGAATVKRDHELVARGPYRFVRHPIYAGGIVAACGTALSMGDVGAFAGAALLALAWLLKIRVEEAILVRAFGDRYIQYARNVPTLIPFLL